MEVTNDMEEPENRAQNAVIDDLENETMQVLNVNASTATLNMQNFGSSAEYHEHRDEIAIAGAGDTPFESMSVDGEVTSGPINALIQQDGQLLQVDSICDDGDIYLTTSNGNPLTYIAVTQSNELGDATNGPITSVINTGQQKSHQVELATGYADNLLGADESYEHCTDNKFDVSTNVPSSSANAIRTQLVPASAIRANPADNQSYHTVTVTLVNDKNEENTDTNYILLLSTDVEGGTATNAGNVLSITEHKPASSAPKTFLLAQRPADTQNGSCSFCNYKTAQRHLLHKHIKTHSEDRPHKCHLCGNAFKTMAALTNHVNTHSGRRPHKCKCCESAFTTSGELIRHIRYKHTFEKPHKCPHCDYAAVELSKMKRHIRTHTGERPYQCTQCTYASPDSYKLKRHIRTHTGEKPYSCDICPLKFTQSNSLKAHRRIHLGSKPVFQCELCPATCGRKTDLRIHIQKLHSREKVPLECRQCHTEFDNRYDYKLHVRSHDGERTYKCALCAFATLTERKLAEHLISQHSSYKPYRCSEEDCDATFRFKSLHRRHKMFVHGLEDFFPHQKNFECTCGKKFTLQSNQLKHQELHAGNTVLSSVISTLKDIEDIDDIGEEISVEISEEIFSSNPLPLLDLPTTVLSSLPSSSSKRYSDDEDTIRQRLEGMADGGNLVMRRIVKQVKGHRVVVMEVGPSELHNLSEDENNDEIHEESIIDDSNEDRMTGDQQFVSGASISQDAAVQILYNLAAESHLAGTSQNQDNSEHQHTEMSSSLPSDRVVTLEMEALPDNVLSESVQEVNEENVLEDNDDQSNLEQISLSVQDASTTLMQLKRSAMEQQIVADGDDDSLNHSKTPIIIDGSEVDIHN